MPAGLEGARFGRGALLLQGGGALAQAFELGTLPGNGSELILGLEVGFVGGGVGFQHGMCLLGADEQFTPGGQGLFGVLHVLARGFQRGERGGNGSLPRIPGVAFLLRAGQQFAAAFQIRLGLGQAPCEGLGLLGRAAQHLGPGTRRADLDLGGMGFILHPLLRIFQIVKTALVDLHIQDGREVAARLGRRELEGVEQASLAHADQFGKEAGKAIRRGQPRGLSQEAPHLGFGFVRDETAGVAHGPADLGMFAHAAADEGASVGRLELDLDLPFARAVAQEQGIAIEAETGLGRVVEERVAEGFDERGFAGAVGPGEAVEAALEGDAHARAIGARAEGLDVLETNGMDAHLVSQIL